MSKKILETIRARPLGKRVALSNEFSSQLVADHSLCVPSQHTSECQEYEFEFRMGHRVRCPPAALERMTRTFKHIVLDQIYSDLTPVLLELRMQLESECLRTNDPKLKLLDQLWALTHPEV